MWRDTLDRYWKIENNRTYHECEVQKDLCLNKRKTGGIVVGASPCGLFLNFFEIIKGESISTICDNLLNIVELLGKNFEYCIYDNACHLSEFVKKKNLTEFSKMKFIIDNFHIKNHKRPKCKLEFSSDNYFELKNINTQVCEQLFSKISKLKHNVKHMSKNHFIFYFIYIFHNLNLIKLNKIKKY